MQSSEMPSSSRAEEGHPKIIFVARLERLLRMRKDYREDLNPVGLRLLDRAIDATYRDCIDYGAGEQARVVMSKHTSRERDL